MQQQVHAHPCIILWVDLEASGYVFRSTRAESYGIFLISIVTALIYIHDSSVLGPTPSSPAFGV